MGPARAALDRAAAAAASVGDPPPTAAYGAALAGHARLGQASKALEVLHAFTAAGGAPDGAMLDAVAGACVFARDDATALAVIRAVETHGSPDDKARVRRTLAGLVPAPERRTARRSRADGGGAGRSESLERIKFWLGLPNSYYGGEEEEEYEEEEARAGRAAGGRGLVGGGARAGGGVATRRPASRDAPPPPASVPAPPPWALGATDRGDGGDDGGVLATVPAPRGPA